MHLYFFILPTHFSLHNRCPWYAEEHDFQLFFSCVVLLVRERVAALIKHQQCHTIGMQRNIHSSVVHISQRQHRTTENGKHNKKNRFKSLNRNRANNISMWFIIKIELVGNVGECNRLNCCTMLVLIIFFFFI